MKYIYTTRRKRRKFWFTSSPSSPRAPSNHTFLPSTSHHTCLNIYPVVSSWFRLFRDEDRENLENSVPPPSIVERVVSLFFWLKHRSRDYTWNDTFGELRRAPQRVTVKRPYVSGGQKLPAREHWPRHKRGFRMKIIIKMGPFREPSSSSSSVAPFTIHLSKIRQEVLPCAWK